MNKGTLPKLTCQLNIEINTDLKGFLIKLRDNFLAVLKALLEELYKYKHTECSNAYLAMRAGVSISTVKRAKAYFVSLGWIQYWPRKRDTFIYILHEFFKSSSIMSQIKRFFSGFFSICKIKPGKKFEPPLIEKEDILKREGAGANTMRADLGLRLLLSNDKEQADWGKLFEGETGPPNKPMPEWEAEEYFGATGCLSGSSAGKTHDNTQNLTKVIEACSISLNHNWNKYHSILQKLLLELELDFELSLLQDELLKIRLLGS